MVRLLFMLGLVLARAGCGWGESGSECPVAVDYGPMGPAITRNRGNPPAPPPGPTSAAGESVPVSWVKIHGRLLESKLVKRVLPDYPRKACEEGTAGAVHLFVAIAKDGSVRDANVVEGRPSFNRAAEKAIRKWRYRPTLVNGNPVEVKTDIHVRFLPATESSPVAQPQWGSEVDWASDTPTVTRRRERRRSRR